MQLSVKQFHELTLEELYQILRLRAAVFVVEQNCPYQDVDGNDQAAYHVFFADGDGIQAYLRAFCKDPASGEVLLGRVIAAKRGCGLGAKVLAEGIRAAKERLHARTVVIEAQSYAKGFYEKQGFQQTSEEFLEDGIPHIQMKLDCTELR